MPTPDEMRETFRRNARAVTLRPGVGQTTGRTSIRVRDGTTCEVTNGKWTFVVDLGKDSGGNDAGPGPGVLERAAFGSCLAMGYATWAAVMDVPLDSIEVDVESDFDARPMLGVTDEHPGFSSIRYHVRIESSAPEEDIRRVIDQADRLSPVRDDFARAIPIARTVEISHPIPTTHES